PVTARARGAGAGRQAVSPRRGRLLALAALLALLAAPAVQGTGGGARAQPSPLGRPPAAAALPLAPAALLGSDYRLPLPARVKDVQEKLGLLFNVRARTVCTAFCVAKDIVATAGHCLHRTAGERRPNLDDFWFGRNYDTVRDFVRIAGHASGTAAQNVMTG